MNRTDVLFGRDSKDLLIGNRGDTLVGGSGGDILVGGPRRQCAGQRRAGRDHGNDIGIWSPGDDNDAYIGDEDRDT